MKTKKLFKHKITKTPVWQYRSYNGTSWDTGVFFKHFKKLKPNTGNIKMEKAFIRAQKILQMRGDLDRGGKKKEFHDAEVDLTKQILFVLTLIATNSAFSFADNVHTKAYLQALDPKHRQPYREKRLETLKAAHKASRQEITFMLEERFIELHTAFCSSNSDFFWSPVLKSSFGCVVCNFIAHQYQFVDGQSLFVSKRTLKKTPDNKLVSHIGKLAMCEVVIALEEFVDPHTASNVYNWLNTNHNGSGVPVSYRMHHSVDGASNAVGSVEMLSMEAQLKSIQQEWVDLNIQLTLCSAQLWTKTITCTLTYH